MQTRKSYFSYNDLLHRLNLCKVPRKKSSASWFLFHQRNSSFGNTVLKIFRICSPNIMWQQRTKDDNIFMVFDFFSFKWPVNPNGTLEKLVVKTKIRCLKIILLDKFLCRITTRITKNLFLHKNLTRTKIKVSASSQI